MTLTPIDLGIVGGLLVRQVRHVREYYDDEPGATTGVLVKDAGARLGVAGVLMGLVAPVEQGLLPDAPLGFLTTDALTLLLVALTAFATNVLDEKGLRAVQKRVPQLRKPEEYGTADVQNLMWWLDASVGKALAPALEPGTPAQVELLAHRARAAVQAFAAAFAMRPYKRLGKDDMLRLRDQCGQVIEAAGEIGKGSASAAPEFRRELRDLYSLLQLRMSPVRADTLLPHEATLDSPDALVPDLQAPRVVARP